MSKEAAEEAVGKISTKLNLAEGHLLKAIAALSAVPKFLEDVHEAGPLELPENIPQFGYIEMIGYSGRATSITGKIGDALDLLSNFHLDAFSRAHGMEIDSEVGVLGGGGR